MTLYQTIDVLNHVGPKSKAFEFNRLYKNNKSSKFNIMLSFIHIKKQQTYMEKFTI